MATTKIHPTAIVSSGASLGADVQVGPYAVIEDDVEIGAGSVIGPHAVIRSHTRMGERNRVHSHAILGDVPQHLAYKPEDVTRLEIGDDNIFRETVTVHRAFHAGAATRIGSGCLLMVACHVGHDCEVGNNVIITNAVLIGGHVTIGDRAVFGGGSSAHQFTRIGPYAMVGANTYLRKDALPYAMISGDPAKHYRLNGVGLRRNGIGGDKYKALEQAFRRLRAGESLDGIPQTDETRLLLDWLQQPSKRGLSGFLNKKNLNHGGHGDHGD
jgi:UDP-N-acetylglucosamine acyltransferase